VIENYRTTLNISASTFRKAAACRHYILSILFWCQDSSLRAKIVLK